MKVGILRANSCSKARSRWPTFEVFHCQELKTRWSKVAQNCSPRSTPDCVQIFLCCGTVFCILPQVWDYAISSYTKRQVFEWKSRVVSSSFTRNIWELNYRMFLMVKFYFSLAFQLSRSIFNEACTKKALKKDHISR